MQNRLEAIVQKNHNQFATNNALKDLMKENENLKWIITSKTTDIEKLQENNNNLKAKIMQLTKKIDSYKLRKNSKKQDNENYLFKENMVGRSNLLNNVNSLPSSLEFRINFLKSEYSSKLYNFLWNKLILKSKLYFVLFCSFA